MFFLQELEFRSDEKDLSLIIIQVKTLDLGRKIYSFISQTCTDPNPPVNCYNQLPNPGSYVEGILIRQFHTNFCTKIYSLPDS